MIKELAEYEDMIEEVVATEDILKEWIFQKKTAKVILGEFDGQIVGYCLYFYNFSTFLGRAGIYLEDLYVRPQYRKKGFGDAFLKNLAKIAVNEGLGRIDWACLDWNKPSIDFYLSKNATQLSDWTCYRLEGKPLKDLAND
ncbi:MAG: GNAT family N-acetyltransferase [Clostridia bacterium]